MKHIGQFTNEEIEVPERTKNNKIMPWDHFSAVKLCFYI